MADAAAVERIVNLALFLAGTPGTVTDTEIRAAVYGYPADQEKAAFKRMLERDKDELRNAGLVIHADDEGNYRLDRRATYVAPFDLAPEDAAAVRAAAVAVLDDPAFPFADDLRLALAKIAAELGGSAPPARTHLADEDPARQGALVAVLASAATRRKTASFGYTNSLGRQRTHDVDPYGLFLHDGRWYLVGRDVERDEARTYAVARMRDVVVNPAAPKTPDFERPADFDVSRFVRLPFQYGPASATFVATLRIEGMPWRARAITGGLGSVESDGDALIWSIEARSVDRLARFVVENGPGIAIVGPPQARAALADGLAHVEAAHV
jgi:proteasome accessory factor B